MGNNETRERLAADSEIRAIATAWMRHLGWTDEAIAEAEAHRCEDTCEDIGFGWDCTDDDGDSRHLEADNLAEACAMANLVIETLTARGWQPPVSKDAEVDIVAAVADLGELSKDIRFWHAGELADRLDAIIARRFGYVVRHVGEETAVAAIPASDFTYVRQLPERKPNVKSQRLDQFAADLRAHPGEWGQWPNSINEITGYTVASRINRGADLRFSGGVFEAVSRLGVLHVRYVGEEAANA